MTTLITGAGLLGTAFARHASRRGERLIFVDGAERDSYLQLRLASPASYESVRADIRNRGSLVELMRARAVDVVVHTAGIVGRGVAESLDEAVDVNVAGSAAVAAAVHAAGVRRLVLVSSFGVYQWQRRPANPVDESFPRGDGGPYSNLTAAKEVVVEAYARGGGFELVVVRPASVFGLGHFAGGSSGGKRIEDLLRSGLRGERTSTPRWGTNEYLYADDLGRALDAAATVPLPSPSFINLGTGRLTDFDSFLAIAKRVIPSLEVAVDPEEVDSPRSAPLDVSAARRLLAWEPAYSLEEALADYVQQLRGLGC